MLPFRASDNCHFAVATVGDPYVCYTSSARLERVQKIDFQWRDKIISTEGDNSADAASKRLQFLRDIATSVQTMNNETKEDLRSQFPTMVNLTEGFGFSVLTTMAMIMQKIMELFATVAAGTTAAPAESPMIDEPEMVKKEEKELTVEALDGYLDIIKIFRGMLPQDFMKTIDSLNITEKGELVSFMSDWYYGRIKKPENKAEIVELIRNKLPSVYEKIDALNTTFYGKFLKLKPETQDLLRSWRDKAISLEGETPAESLAKRLQFIKDVALSMQTMNNETKEDIRSQFPTAVNLTEGIGFTILTTMAMIVQKIMDTFAAGVATTLAPQDCAVPVNL
ncbi:hypothetical protein OESDEN_00920 [Oesophagostomum dentatum]|uniref:Uncharacterized protein n=1 Tax=Oesophagostomum dentatum TaxID=61180 RepID=A0A0B1TSL9_OESDE|nr:hypothetical protein OESDEN_00920 [Oesophagostomum dentatum]